MATSIHRKEAVGMDQIVSDYIKSLKISSGLNQQRIYEAWNVCSGVSAYTLDRYYKNGTLYITLSSSVLRTQLFLQRPSLIYSMNQYLEKDPLFTKDDKKVGFIKQLVLK